VTISLVERLNEFLPLNGQRMILVIVISAALGADCTSATNQLQKLSCTTFDLDDASIFISVPSSNDWNSFASALSPTRGST